MQHGANIFLDNPTHPALYVASLNGHADVVGQLLAHPDIDINSARISPQRRGQIRHHFSKYSNLRGEIPRTALRVASWYGHTEIVDRLQACAGIDVNKGAPLLCASEQGHITVVEMLLTHPTIDVNLTPEVDDLTALTLAVVTGHSEIVKCLLAHPSIDVNKSTPLHFAASVCSRTPASPPQSYEAIEQLLARPDLDVNRMIRPTRWCSHPVTALTYAIMNGDPTTQSHFEFVDHLLAHPNIDVNKTRCTANDAGRDAHIVNGENKDEGKDEGKDERSSRSPLYSASEKGYFKIVDLLLARPEIDVNQRYKLATALHAASENNHLAVVERLLAHPNVDAKNFRPPLPVWECKSDSGWIVYSARVSAALEEKYSINESKPSPRPSLKIKSKFGDTQAYTYEWCMERMVQRNASTGKERHIRRTTVPRRIGLAWCTTGDNVSPGVKKYHITKKMAKSPLMYPREQLEFQKAVAHFTGSATAHKTVVAVDVYDSPLLQHQFECTQLKFASDGKPSESMLVFHGTHKNNIEAIMCYGLEVGGEGIVAATNGSQHGKGVYTASGPATPIEYAKGGAQCVILAEALPGVEGKRGGGSGSVDSWRPKSDWIVFRSGRQLLPRWVVHWK